MKGMVIKELIYEGSLAFVHGAGFWLKRLCFEGMALYIYKEEVGLYLDFDLDPEKYHFEKLGMVEIPNELVEKLLP